MQNLQQQQLLQQQQQQQSIFPQQTGMYQNGQNGQNGYVSFPISLSEYDTGLIVGAKYFSIELFDCVMKRRECSVSLQGFEIPFRSSISSILSV